MAQLTMLVGLSQSLHLHICLLKGITHNFLIITEVKGVFEIMHPADTALVSIQISHCIQSSFNSVHVQKETSILSYSISFNSELFPNSDLNFTSSTPHPHVKLDIQDFNLQMEPVP
jgi:hypothetical protein